jgi:hypothetical protein
VSHLSAQITDALQALCESATAWYQKTFNSSDQDVEAFEAALDRYYQALSESERIEHGPYGFVTTYCADRSLIVPRHRQSALYNTTTTRLDRITHRSQIRDMLINAGIDPSKVFKIADLLDELLTHRNMSFIEASTFFRKFAEAYTAHTQLQEVLNIVLLQPGYKPPMSDDTIKHIRTNLSRIELTAR